MCTSTDDDAGQIFLEVHGSGYSRFEFDGNEIVTFHTNGVEFSYMGYAGVADDLHYNHARKSIDATGNIELHWDDGAIRTDTLQIDSISGLARTGNIHGAVESIDVSYQASNLEVQFPQGATSPSPEELEGRLADVLAELPHELIMQVDSIDYSGPAGRSWQLVTPTVTGGPGVIELTDGQLLDLSGLDFACDLIYGTLGDDLVVNEVVMKNISLESAGLVLAAREVIVHGVIDSTRDLVGNELSAALTPVDILVSLDGKISRFHADEAKLASGQEELRIELSGGVVVDGVDLSLDTNHLVLYFSYAGLAIEAPGNVSLGFDLSELTDITPIDLTTAGLN